MSVPWAVSAGLSRPLGVCAWLSVLCAAAAAACAPITAVMVVGGESASAYTAALGAVAALLALRTRQGEATRQGGGYPPEPERRPRRPAREGPGPAEREHPDAPQARIGACACLRTCESLACSHVSGVGVVARGCNPIAYQLPAHSPGERPNRRAMSRIENPSTRHPKMSMRSLSDKNR